MASAAHPHQTPHAHLYLDALLAAIPHDTVPPEVASASRDGQASSHPYPQFLDAALRLATGGPARPDDAPHLRAAWPEVQASVQRALHALHPPSSSPSEPANKRRRSPSPQQHQQQHAQSLPTTNNKKPKHDIGEGRGDDDDDDDDAADAPHLTIHALSATAPVRHKVDVTLHACTLRLAHGGTGAPVARCARTAFTRAFLLPTRARASGALQWTALLLAGDKPAPPAARGGGKGAKSRAGGANANAAGGARFELACSVPEAGAPPRMTVHPSTSTSTPASSSRPPSSAREAFLALLSSAPIAGHRGGVARLTTVERGTPLAGITAFRGVRETSLWFFDAGILADARPAEFWALADLARGEAGVRVRTATGRTCSVILTRRPPPSEKNKNTEEEEEEEDVDEEGEETEFQLIDGKEREGILEWVRRHRDAFGIVDAVAEAEGEGEGEGNEGKVGAGRGDSDSDSDFEASSGTSDGGSSSSSSSSSASGDSAGEDEAEGSQQSASERGESDGDDDDDEEVELDPKHHPLLRAAGALPKISRAAVDAAVGLVVDDLVGRTVGGPGPPPASVQAQAQDDGEDEEDELED
ncbi:hypothetical protein BJV78DRAFT_691984 [Lactifluus subvellereus]|nr:hypothetical protein BJV78DRAFT_691984 [Lactifluus subvellereus]